MSITFTPDLEGELPTIEPCLCVQDDEKFVEWMEYGPGPPVEMRAAAYQDCHICLGSGIEPGARAAYPELNLSNQNAYALLRAMGVAPQHEGSMSIILARRGLMRARARKSLEPFTSPDTMVSRFIAFGLSSEGLKERIERFSNFVESVASLGATKIFWY